MLFDLIIGGLDFMAKILPSQFEDPAELAKIGKYYAVEDMLTTDPAEKASVQTIFFSTVHLVLSFTFIYLFL